MNSMYVPLILLVFTQKLMKVIVLNPRNNYGYSTKVNIIKNYSNHRN